MNNMIKNKGTGRREKRREIKQIVATNSRHVTFSKRRVGLFKKASELCALTGAECAILCESLGGRVFAFGHPSVESVVDKYLGDKTSSEFPASNSETDMNPPCMHEKLKKQYLEIAQEIEIEKKKYVKVMGGKNVDFNNISNNTEKGDLFWWEQPFDHLEVEELVEYVSSMEQLINNLKFRADDLMLIKSYSSMFGADKALNSSDAGLSNESLANKNLVAKDIDGQPDELLVNKNVNFSDEDLLDNLLATKDDELHDFFNDLQLRDNNVLVPNVYGTDTGNEVQLPRNNGNYVVPDDYSRAMDLRNFHAAGVLPNDFSYYFPPN